MSEEKLWGGRFEGGVDPKFFAFNRSFDFDRRLLEAEIRASIAHCNALTGAGVLTEDEAEEIRRGLNTIGELALAKPNYLEQPAAEDVHSFVEARLVELIGETGRKLHTGRSRNDQVATDLRLWLRAAIDTLAQHLQNTQFGLLELAESNRGVVIPGYTHLQRAQPVLFAHWCLAYFEMLARDRQRLQEVRARVNVLPLGAAALAGTSFPIDREAVARELGFDSVSANSLDAVSDRDFCVEFVNAMSLVMVHLSRWAEDIILYTTTEFGFLTLGDAVSTGSSLMPQKKNPDSLELIRGKAGRVFGHGVALQAMLKGLPLAYNKDMQEDKEALFDSFDTVSRCLETSTAVLDNLKVNETRAREAATTGYLNATELADYLVRKGTPFREAHEIVGKIVLRALQLGLELNDLPAEELRRFSPLVDEDVASVLSLDSTLTTKSQIGGTAPERVVQALSEARKRI
jgi:argininosuccinate lyase